MTGVTMESNALRDVWDRIWPALFIVTTILAAAAGLTLVVLQNNADVEHKTTYHHCMVTKLEDVGVVAGRSIITKHKVTSSCGYGYVDDDNFDGLVDGHRYTFTVDGTGHIDIIDKDTL